MPSLKRRLKLWMTLLYLYATCKNRSQTSYSSTLRSIVIPVIQVFKEFESVTAFFSTRLGGASKAPFDALNLGYLTQDNPQIIRRNWQQLGTQFGFDPNDVIYGNQIHSDNRMDASKVDRRNPPQADSLYTSNSKLTLAIFTADCVPILIYDPENSSMAAVHAGWRGTQKQILGKTIKDLHQQGRINLATTRVAIGPCISQNHYEVGPEVARQFEASFIKSINKKLYLDLIGPNVAQLDRSGIHSQNISLVNHCTFTQSDQYFSYRREGYQTGRMAAIIKLA